MRTRLILTLAELVRSLWSEVLSSEAERNQTQSFKRHVCNLRPSSLKRDIDDSAPELALELVAAETLDAALTAIPVRFFRASVLVRFFFLFIVLKVWAISGDSRDLRPSRSPWPARERKLRARLLRV